MADKVSAGSEIKKLVYADPDMKPEAILAVLTARGVKTSLTSVQTYRSDFLHSVAVLKALGAFASAPKEKAPKAARAKKKQSRASRWSDACTTALAALEDLRALQEEYEEWRDNLPENLQQSPVGEKLDAVCELDIESAVDTVSEAEGIDLPRGFGKD